LVDVRAASELGQLPSVNGSRLSRCVLNARDRLAQQLVDGVAMPPAPRDDSVS